MRPRTSYDPVIRGSCSRPHLPPLPMDALTLEAGQRDASSTPSCRIAPLARERTPPVRSRQALSKARPVCDLGIEGVVATKGMNVIPCRARLGEDQEPELLATRLRARGDAEVERAPSEGSSSIEARRIVSRRGSSPVRSGRSNERRQALPARANSSRALARPLPPRPPRRP
jgi:hypothetical protein